MMAAGTRIWRIRSELAYRKLVDGGMLYDHQRKKVHHFNETAARVWEACQDGRTTAEIVEILYSVYTADEAQIRTDVEEIIEEFAESDLLQ